MRIAALYDVHGNLPALEAVLAEVESEDVDLIVVGGDVAAGGFPSETIERLRTLGDRVRWIRGNADRELMPGEEGNAPAHVLEWVRERLSDEQIAFLHRLPPQLELDLDGVGHVLFVHATPRNDTEVFTSATPGERLEPVFAGVDADLVVCGHTHMQFERAVGPVQVVNAGSVGMPYEEAPGAFWALLGEVDGGPIDLRRTPYDVAAALEAIAATGYPEEWPQASPTEATAFFETLDLRV